MNARMRCHICGKLGLASRFLAEGEAVEVHGLRFFRNRFSKVWWAGIRVRLLIAALALSGLSVAAQTQPAEKTADAAPSPSFRLRGVVKSGNIPLPGVTVTAANSLTGKKAITSTDVDGSYFLEVSDRGRYVVRAEMSAFAAATQEVVLNPGSPQQQANFSLVLLSRAPKPEQSGTPEAVLSGTLARDVRGSQPLSVNVDDSALAAAGSGGASAGEPAALGGVAGLANSPDAANPSVAFAGQLGNTPGFLGGIRTSDELRDRLQQMGTQPGGGPGMGPGGGGLGAALGGGPFVIRRNRLDINQPHGTFYYSAGNSLFNASSYSLNGQGGSNPGYNSSRFGGLIGGPLRIPHLVEDNKTFVFGGYTGTRATTPYVVYSTVPTQAEREVPGIDATANLLLNGTPNIAPYIPLPNQTGGGAFNYRYATSSENDSDNLFLRITHNFSGSGPRMFGGGGGRGSNRPHNNLNFNFTWLRNESSQLTPFPTASGTKGTSSFNTGFGWAVGKGNWNNILRTNFNCARVDVTNLYAGNSDIDQTLGIPGASTNPLDWGLPNISIKGFTPLTDIAPQYRDDATLQFSETAIWYHHKHNLRFGGDYRRLWTTLRSNANPRGSFTFTGFDTGSPLADFLEGAPQSAALQYSATPYFFSTNSYDFFLQDDWRVRSNFTFQIGLRYEYIAPYTEANDRLANLDLAFASTGLVSATCVTPAGAILPASQSSYACANSGSASLIKPDRNNFAPRAGFAWKVEKNTVVRGGYGINYNLSQYGLIITQLAYQPPFATALTAIASAPGVLSFADAFTATSSGALTNNYGVDPNYRLAYVQLWNLNIQHEFGTSLLVNIGYNGSKGTDLDTMTAPNRTLTGLLLPNVGAFNYETSQGSSILHAGTLRVRKRLSHGLAVGATYVYSKSIDDASSIGGEGGVVVAQNPLTLSAERGLSSFDQRHKFTGDFLYELPFGTGKRWLSTAGPRARVFGDWTVSGSFTIASGTPFSPYFLDNISDVARGSNGTLRPNLVAGQSIQLANPGIGEWFNTAAFCVPGSSPSCPAGYGNAGRNIIIGPGTIVFNMSVAKTFPFRGTKSLEFRATASNVFNHPNYSAIDTNMNSPTFGQVTSVASMRQLQFLSRFRF